MFRRRRKDDDEEAAAREPVDDESTSNEPTADDDATEASFVRTDGPFDLSELEPEEARRNRVDLGGMLVRGVPGMKIQLQVDQRSGRGTSVLLGLEDAAVQLVAVAAPRTSGLWDQTRLQIVADAERRGGSAEEGAGPFGTEARVVLPVKTKDGKQGRQPSRVSGIDGPRWMLRATFLGKAITEATALQRLVELVRQVVVVRGDGPMPPGEVIPLQPPPKPEEAEQGGATITATDEMAAPTDDAAGSQP